MFALPAGRVVRGRASKKLRSVISTSAAVQVSSTQALSVGSDIQWTQTMSPRSYMVTGYRLAVKNTSVLLALP